MSLYNNSDYEIISNAEVSSVINKYSPEMVTMALDEILKRKSLPFMNPMANLITSYENNLKIDMAKYPQFQNDMLENRTESFTLIMDKICAVHNLSYQLPSGTDIYTAASLIYQFLVSGYYPTCVSFFVNFFKREAKSIRPLVDKFSDKADISTTQVYTSDRYLNADLAAIHINMNEALSEMHSFDISLGDIITTAYANSPMAATSEFLISMLTDNGKFYNFYLDTIDKYRANIITDIRLQLMPISSQIKNYIEED